MTIFSLLNRLIFPSLSFVLFVLPRLSQLEPRKSFTPPNTSSSDLVPLVLVSLIDVECQRIFVIRITYRWTLSSAGGGGLGFEILMELWGVVYGEDSYGE